MKFRIRYADRIVGVFIFVAILALVMLLFFLGSNQRWFARNYYYNSRFLSANNLNPGTGIFLKGFEIGKIDSILLNDEDTVDVSFYIYDTYIDRVSEDSILELSVSPIGLGTSLQFHRGKNKNLLPEESFIPSLDFDDARYLVEAGRVDIPSKDDTITRLFANANQTLAGVSRTVSLVNQALEGRGEGELKIMLDDIKHAIHILDLTMVDVQNMVASISGQSKDVLGSAGSALGNLDEALPGLLNELDGSLQNLAKLTEALADPTGLVPRLLDAQGSIKTILNDDNSLWDSISSIMASINRVTQDLEKTSAGLAAQIPQLSSLLTDVKTIMTQTQDVLEGLKNNPLLRDGIPDRPLQESRLNSLRGGEF